MGRRKRIGNQVPTYSYTAPYEFTEGPLAADFADAYGTPPHQWQKTVLDDWLAVDSDGTLVNSLCLLTDPRQNGKALSLDTEIPTPDGWKPMADIHVGDYVFGQNGKPSRVTLESEIFHKPMYRVTFDDGATIDASEDHVWTVQTHDSIQASRYVPKARPKRTTGKYHGDGWYELTTKDMLADHIKPRNDGRFEYRYRVPMNAAVEYPWCVLPVQPYLLGAWLGDGTTKNATITVSEDDIPETIRIFAECGETLTRQKTKDRAPCFRIGRKTESREDSGSFYKRLKALGVIRNKHIPEQYMVASIEQRWALLQGLMDTDGYCSKAGQCEFVQKRRELCEQVLELCASLGIKARMHEKQATCNGKPAGTVYRITFFTDSAHPCFRMERKRKRLKDSIANRTTYKAIASIERIEDVPSKCIAIDNDSHLYLAGRQYTATHNTGVCVPREDWGIRYRNERILHTAQEYQTSRVAFDRLREKFGNCKHDINAKYPELNRLVDRYTTSAGQMILDLKDGGHIEFRTRGNSGDMGRGGTFDVIVIDEAQSYTDEQDAALSPLNSAAPSGSPQTIMMGTVPDPRKPHKGEVFMRLHDMSHADPYVGMCAHEWGTDEVGDVTDEDRWYETNPSLGMNLLISGLRKDSKSMSAETFAREHLGWWGGVVSAVKPIDRALWNACCISDADAESLQGSPVYSVKFDKDGQVGSIAVCLVPHENRVRPHVEYIDSWPLNRGIGRFLEWFLDASQHAMAIVLDGRSDAMTLYGKLVAAGVDDEVLILPKSYEVADACSGFVDAVRSRELTHINQEQTSDALHKCTKRKIGNAGGYGFDSEEPVDTTIAECMALAHWWAVKAMREPAEEMMINL